MKQGSGQASELPNS